MTETAVTTENKYGKLDIELTGDLRTSRVELEGKLVPILGLDIRMSDTTTVEIEMLNLGNGEPYTIEGYLISEEDWQWLQANKPVR